jgi:DNA-binding transcriptional LysR family regulator
MCKIWIEAALNGAWSRAFQPGIPDTVQTIIEEGVACARAGAAIVHAHAYDGGGRQGWCGGSPSVSPAGFAYYVVYPPRALQRSGVKAFRDWLLAEAR